ncbi:hypothetical protein AOR_1_1440194 [Paecilomyces variotii No. 5]|uniref:PARP-type domain-containing protein n=1 Tax=Byssochlamys spectabilis (strain No. 5 / NBRC 109023) TaxID=1356009 RepID=V5G780_BYSSN|nr:hypothetical protein AOR_1_1440194 [Paecilomyces variotii No. 5]
MGTYRLEEASTGRAGCQNKECKDQKIKIAKGEFRLGTWVDNERFQSFFWRHWGCVTPKIVASLKETLDEANGDYSAVDGYDGISSENQAKVREAVEQGHVSDSDWKGDVEMNRPGKTGFRARATKKKASAEEDGSKSDAEEEAPAAKKGRAGAKGKAKKEDTTPATKKAKKEAPAADDDAEPAGANEDVPVKKRGRPAKSGAPAEKKTEKEAKPAAKGGKRKLADADASPDAEPAAAENPEPRPPKRGRKSAGAEEPVAAEEKPKRGRKKAASTQDQEAEKAPSETKPTRGRKKASA